ncbi:hypothetical protein DCO48_19400 [Pseudomonas sp. SDI]|uniref:hypothetical protein n=1 Tax=Pseudomonas sp. SDI TaxID=2170734 RepID=UPI000DE5C4DC|nr:hypothetical protein [Pseudomonas sp. SDI]PWB30720.1 hypothetical protein DCO48_19400 [Pseudomonas sp. SDI]
MPYVALEFDHRIAQPAIQWIVVSCSGVGEKCGGPIALSPRHDVAYFLDQATAEHDARMFAEYKNNADAETPPATGQPARHYAYQWDHHVFSSTLCWGVLNWSGIEGVQSKRTDVAYFVDPSTAQADSRAFSFMRDKGRA